MKRSRFFILVCCLATVLSCSDDDVKRKGDPDIKHEGVKWRIVSLTYTMTNMGGTGVGMKSGTKANAGAFYFQSEATRQGSFEFEVEGINKEDHFTYTDNDGSISIVSIDQDVDGLKTSQNVISLAGEYDGTTITLNGTIIQQSASTGQFILTGEFVLERE